MASGFGFASTSVLSCDSAGGDDAILAVANRIAGPKTDRAGKRCDSFINTVSSSDGPSIRTANMIASAFTNECSV
jgi:hypothetical protein